MDNIRKERSPYVEKCRNALKDCIYLEDSSIQIEGYNIYGSPYTPEFCNWGFNVERGELLKKRWEKIPSNTDILITHGPPLGIGDITTEGIHVGCTDLLHRVEELEPKLHVFGHIHEAYGLYQLNNKKTIFANASTCTVRNMNEFLFNIVVILYNFQAFSFLALLFYLFIYLFFLHSFLIALEMIQSLLIFQKNENNGNSNNSSNSNSSNNSSSNSNRKNLPSSF